ncbi:uncharacterized protein BO95DRAFT_21428 [Aspergillus brunneoviolaceus CBS 621.78]|nr:hypothetical protein BO95DRAFT_21428 [Aspergillus brunneoviolaceus CBS 621.78]RAH40250.1 hypothetical protein BO95DRAFT_21428 [Aspergillus brunneoviolaceus CBS 621.78]
MRRCEATYNAFAKTLSRLTSHSDEDRLSWRDRGRLHLERREIASLKNGLQKGIETLDIAINMATLRSTRQNQDALRTLERRIVTSMSEFAGEIQGLQMAIQSLPSPSESSSITRTDVDQVVSLLKRQIDLIQQSLRVCDSGLRETSRSTGTTVANARVLDKARQLIGNIGSDVRLGPHTLPVNISHAEARDNAYHGVGNISDAALEAFLR